MGAPGATRHRRQLSLVNEDIARAECCVLLPELWHSSKWQENTALLPEIKAGLSPEKQDFTEDSKTTLLLESYDLEFSGKSNCKENIIRMSDKKEFGGRWKCVSAHPHWQCLFSRILPSTLISKQLEIDNVFICFNLSAAKDRLRSRILGILGC